ncbi:glycoside hydrolase domain-containing protein [Paenibacillus sp. FSL L8-0502]|uniref:glycoside hydrolase domain-containing protein n=1 Tax=Paenibacillus sp. FSL L8-0502 TaxID=2954619 RepID=UPI0031599029
MDEMVRKVQNFVNVTYSTKPGYKMVTADGNTGWGTIKALIQGLQFELGVSPADGDFGPATLAACPTLSSSSPVGNLVLILQGALYCKGYSTNGMDGQYGNGTRSAVSRLQADAGLPNPDGIATPIIMKALLNMDAFVNVGDSNIRAMQQVLNSKYYKYITPKLGLIPCDGLYSSKTNRALIYGLQVEQGNTNPDGVFGTTTLSLCPTLNVGNTKSNFISLLKYALYVNDFKSITLNGVYDTQTKSVVAEFQRFCALSSDGIAGKQTWASLLVSTGDRNRKGTACDCVTEITPARAKALKTNGYTTVGRYIVGGDWKRLKQEELNVILSSGLRVFPIYQTSGNGVDYFKPGQGMKDAIEAHHAANKFGFKDDTIIYFSVDFDAVDYQVTSNILPHFKAIHDKLTSLGSKYKVGIYGPRNVCSRVAAAGYSVSSFICDMSTGFSGNLGYPLPKDWAFDQISTISVGNESENRIEIDNNIASGRDQGVSSINTGINNTLVTQNNLFFKQMDEIYKYALEYTSNDIYQANQRVLEYYRSRIYDGILWDITANPVDEKFVKLINEKIPDFRMEVLYDLGTENMMDVPHMLATVNSYTTLADNSVIAELGGWAGDLLTAAGDVSGSVKRNVYPTAYSASLEIIGTTKNKSTFDLMDLVADVDAVYLVSKLIKGSSYSKLNEEMRDRYSTAVQIKDKISFFVKNKFGTLENAQTQAENILISELPLTFSATRKVFKTMFKNIYKETISYTDEEGKEIARGFKDALASMMNA